MSFIYAHSLTDIIAILIYYVTFNTTTSLWKRQNGWWKVSEADWFYFSFQDLSCFFYDPSWSESNFILFLLFLFDPSWSESIWVDPTQTGGPGWSGTTFVLTSFEWDVIHAPLFIIHLFHTLCSGIKLWDVAWHFFRLSIFWFWWPYQNCRFPKS